VLTFKHFTESKHKKEKTFHVEMYVHHKDKPVFRLLRGSTALSEEYREHEHDALEGDLHKIVGEFKPSSLDHETITNELHAHLAKHGYHSAAASHPVVLSPREQKFKSEFKARTIPGGGRHEKPHSDGTGVKQSSRYVGVWSTRGSTHIFNKNNKRIPDATKDNHVTVFNDKEVKHAASGEHDRWFARIADVRKTPASGLSTLSGGDSKNHSLHGNNLESFIKSKEPNGNKLDSDSSKWLRQQPVKAAEHRRNAEIEASAGNHADAAKLRKKADKIEKKHKEVSDWVKKEYPEYHPDNKG
jgi:hypothetical protein